MALIHQPTASAPRSLAHGLQSLRSSRRTISFLFRPHRVRRNQPQPGSAGSSRQVPPRDLNHHCNPATSHFRPWESWTFEPPPLRERIHVPFWGRHRGFLDALEKVQKQQTSLYLRHAFFKSSAQRSGGGGVLHTQIRSTVLPNTWIAKLGREVDSHIRSIVESFSTPRGKRSVVEWRHSSYPPLSPTRGFSPAIISETHSRHSRTLKQSDVPSALESETMKPVTSGHVPPSLHNTGGLASCHSTSISIANDRHPTFRHLEPRQAPSPEHKAQPGSESISPKPSDTLVFQLHEEKLINLRDRLKKMQLVPGEAPRPAEGAVLVDNSSKLAINGNGALHQQSTVDIVAPKTQQSLDSQNRILRYDTASLEEAPAPLYDTGRQLSRLKKGVLVCGSIVALAYIVGVGNKLFSNPSDSTAATEFLTAVRRSRAAHPS